MALCKIVLDYEFVLEGCMSPLCYPERAIEEHELSVSVISRLWTVLSRPDQTLSVSVVSRLRTGLSKPDVVCICYIEIADCVI